MKYVIGLKEIDKRIKSIYSLCHILFDVLIGLTYVFGLIKNKGTWTFL